MQLNELNRTRRVLSSATDSTVHATYAHHGLLHKGRASPGLFSRCKFGMKWEFGVGMEIDLKLFTQKGKLNETSSDHRVILGKRVISGIVGAKQFSLQSSNATRNALGYDDRNQWMLDVPKRAKGNASWQKAWTMATRHMRPLQPRVHDIPVHPSGSACRARASEDQANLDKERGTPLDLGNATAERHRAVKRLTGADTPQIAHTPPKTARNSGI
jgi:hypothetical protein